MTNLIDVALVAFIPVGLSFITYALTTEIKKAKSIRIDHALRRCGVVQIEVGRGGKWKI